MSEQAWAKNMCGSVSTCVRIGVTKTQQNGSRQLHGRQKTK